MKNKVSNKRWVIITLLSLLFLSSIHFANSQEQTTKYEKAVVYYNEACSMCSMYIKDELIPTLEEVGIKEIIKKDYVNDKNSRIELNNLNERYDIPPAMQGHFMIFIDDKIILGGHVPKHIIVDLLTQDFEIDDKLLVLQDEMDDAKSYFAWGFKGDPKEYSINIPIKEYVDWFNENKATLKEPENNSQSSWNARTMIPLIVSTGFLDGINPCAFAVLLFFLAFLYTIQKTKANIVKMGVTYIFAIFLAYFLIGIGLIKAFIFTGSPHLVAKISSYLIISLGLINVYGFFVPKTRIKLGIPTFSKKYLQNWIYKATIPAAFIVGFLVGLCTFPCSGGIYVAVVSLLVIKTTYLQGLAYLLLYNLFFVMPLILIFVFASSKKATEKISEWERSESKVMKLILGLIMIALGIVILIWFV